MGNWFSDYMGNRSGESQKVDLKAQQERYKESMGDTKDRYNEIYNQGEQDTKIDSSNNEAIRTQFQESAADNSAEASRLASRNIAMGGGGNATATAFNVADSANNASATADSAFAKTYQANRQSGLETMAGSTANMGQIDNNAFNMNESGIAANKKIDADAAKYKMQMGMGALKVGGNLMMGNPIGALAAGASMFQEGGWIGQAMQDGGDVEGDLTPLDSQKKMQMYKYNQAKKAEQSMGLIKGYAGGALLGSSGGARGTVAGALIGGLYNRYRMGKQFEESNEDMFNEADREQYKEYMKNAQGRQNGGMIQKAYMQQGGFSVDPNKPVGNGMSDEDAYSERQMGMQEQSQGYQQGGDVMPQQNKFQIPTRLGGQIIG